MISGSGTSHLPDRDDEPSRRDEDYDAAAIEQGHRNEAAPDQDDNACQEDRPWILPIDKPVLRHVGDPLMGATCRGPATTDLLALSHRDPRDLTATVGLGLVVPQAAEARFAEFTDTWRDKYPAMVAM